jgi:hypothetical protein
MPLFQVRQEICTPQWVIVIADTAEEAEDAASRFPEAWTEDKSYVQDVPTQELEEDECTPTLRVTKTGVEHVEDVEGEDAADTLE